jgi:hypothetical protein
MLPPDVIRVSRRRTPVAGQVEEVLATAGQVEEVLAMTSSA